MIVFFWSAPVALIFAWVIALKAMRRLPEMPPEWYRRVRPLSARWPVIVLTAVSVLDAVYLAADLGGMETLIDVDGRVLWKILTLAAYGLLLGACFLHSYRTEIDLHVNRYKAWIEEYLQRTPADGPPAPPKVIYMAPGANQLISHHNSFKVRSRYN